MPRAPSDKRPANPAKRQALSRERLRNAGGRVVSIRLNAEDAKNLDAIMARIKLTATSAISYAIERLARTL